MANPFQTPANERSFSGLIDAVILATGKPGSLTSIVQYANAVIKECQALGLFAQDMLEDQIIVPNNQQGPVIWTRPALFRSLRTVKYVSCDIYPDLILPGKKQKHQHHFFYAADNYFVFAGAGSNETIAYATYYWTNPLGYYGQLGVNTGTFPGGPYPTRPAFFDSNAMIWQYLNTAGDAYVDTTGDPDEDAILQRGAMNWLIDQWWDLILSGTKSKTLTSSGDPRASAEYSTYKQMQKLLQLTSQYEGEGF